MARLIRVSSLSIHRDRAPQTLSVLPPPFSTSMTILLLLCNVLLSLSEALIRVLHLNTVVITSQNCHGWIFALNFKIPPQ